MNEVHISCSIGGLFNNRTRYVYRRLQVDLKHSKPEAIVAIVVSIVATTFSIVATFFAIVATFFKKLKTQNYGNSSNIFPLYNRLMTIVATFLEFFEKLKNHTQ